MRNIDFSTPASELENKEIKLWDRSIVPLQAVSVTHDEYKAYPVLQSPPQSQRMSYTPNPHKLDDRTEAKEAYKAYKVDAPAPPVAPSYMPSPHKFQGTSVTHADFQAQPIERTPAAQRMSYTPNPHKLDGRTTNQDTYRVVQLPMGVQALGVRTQGGGFHPLIPAGSVAPARGSAIFTTTSDHQSTVAIKVIALVAGKPEPLGSFELSALPPALAGVPQLHVTFDLDEQMVLRVSAEDRTKGGQKASIVIKDRLPTPPRERPS